MTDDLPLRLPDRNTRWVWEIDKPQARLLIEVVKVQFNGEEWWVFTKEILPDDYGSSLTHTNNLDRFWEAVTPVGGRIEDLSHPISKEQYKRTPDAIPKG